MNDGSGQSDRWTHGWMRQGRWPCVLLMCAMCATGCAHYGLGGQTSEADDEGRAVDVWTVQAPAHWSIDTSRMTTRLVQALQTQGTPASWRRDAADHDSTRATLKCRLLLPPFEGHGSWTGVDATVRCQLNRRGSTLRSLEGRGSASLATTGPSVPGAVAISAETAAVRAIDVIALRVSRTLTELRSE